MGRYPLGYPDIRQDFRGKGASAPESAPAGGYPLALAGIRQRITDIRCGKKGAPKEISCTSPLRNASYSDLLSGVTCLMVLLIYDSLLIPSCFLRCHPLSPPRTPHVTPPTPVSPGTPLAAHKQVSHRRFRLWSTPNPASAPRRSPLLVAPPQYTLNPRSAVGRDPRCPPVPGFPRSKLFRTLHIRSTFPCFPAPRKARLSTNALPLSSACVHSVSSACFPHQPQAFRMPPPKQTDQIFGQGALLPPHRNGLSATISRVH
ncbi:hypothetical protein PGT21_025601 [Puccinia graminis f. sp. tritici]|uniref:Uncharacterized protein n=1 Tax=Puccinia graminis f. sp. tritici TaxID=56615 RepID=A0A5B0QJR8_PUCGR|nr:hypothetical protein PGT21_025601 [Puccinia graminis f. sp. tritici]